jgi:hypothetical protein
MSAREVQEARGSTEDSEVRANGKDETGGRGARRETALAVEGEAK